VQRADLNPLEEAEGYRALMDEFGNSQEEIAKIVGKSRSYVANTLRLLKLPDPVKAYIHTASSRPGTRACWSASQMRKSLLRDRRPRSQRARSRSDGARAGAKERKKTANGRKARGSPAKTADMLAFEKRVSDATGLVVSIDHHDDHGTLSIRYRSLEQLDDLVQKLARKH
jgi:ParB family chromosome partitioning protein